MAEKRSQKNSQLFMGLVVSLQVSTLQYLGKLVSPHTGKVERDLEGAAASIDMLDMLAEKTQGNLSSEDDHFLKETLQHLKLNYVEEVHKPQTEAASPASAEAPTGENQTSSEQTK